MQITRETKIFFNTWMLFFSIKKPNCDNNNKKKNEKLLLSQFKSLMNSNTLWRLTQIEGFLFFNFYFSCRLPPWRSKYIQCLLLFKSSMDVDCKSHNWGYIWTMGLRFNAVWVRYMFVRVTRLTALSNPTSCQQVEGIHS